MLDEVGNEIRAVVADGDDKLLLKVRDNTNGDRVVRRRTLGGLDRDTYDGESPAILLLRTRALIAIRCISDEAVGDAQFVAEVVYILRGGLHHFDPRMWL